MKKLVASIATVLSLATPAAALNPQLTDSNHHATPYRKLTSSKSLGNPKQVTVEQVYLTILNQTLAKSAPAYLNLSNQDKLNYGRYTCKALDAGSTLDKVFVDFVQAVMRDVSPEIQSQAGFFMGSSMAVSVQSLCPEYLPQMMDWAKTRGFTPQ